MMPMSQNGLLIFDNNGYLTFDSRTFSTTVLLRTFATGYGTSGEFYEPLARGKQLWATMTYIDRQVNSINASEGVSIWIDGDYVKWKKTASASNASNLLISYGVY